MRTPPFATPPVQADPSGGAAKVWSVPRAVDPAAVAYGGGRQPEETPPAQPKSSQAYPDSELAALARMLRRQWRLILAGAVLGVALSLAVVAGVKNRYTAGALLLLGRSEPASLAAPSEPPPNPDDEVEILKSDRIARRVTQRIDSWFPAPAAAGEARTGEDGTPSPKLESAIRSLSQKVAIRRRGVTNVISIEATFDDPQRAAQVANLFAAEYLDERAAAKVRSLDVRQTGLSRRLAELSERLQRAEPSPSMREAYQDTLKQIADIARRRSAAAPDASIISEAHAPIAPSFPRRGIVLALGTVAGLGAAVALAFVRDGKRRRVETVQDLERATGGSEVHPIPRWRKPWLRKGTPQDCVAARKPSTYLEAIGRLYLALLPGRAEPCRSVMITSMQSGDGTTTLALSLARAAASGGLRTVVVDFDLRQPRLHGRTGAANEVGAAEPLEAGRAEELGLRSDCVPGCMVMTAGPELGPLVGRLLRPAHMRRLLQRLEGQFDLVLLDAPAVATSVDAFSLAAEVDHVLLLARAGRADPNAVRTAMRHLRRSGAEVSSALNFAPGSSCHF